MLNTSQSSNTTTAAGPVMPVSVNQNGHAKSAHAAGKEATDVKGTGKSDAAKNGVADSQDRFLKLLVTQMKNQDPLNPMDNAQVTSQMAQLSTVSGIDKLNATLNALSGSMISSQSMQSASMIGRVVVVPGNKIELKGGTGAAALDMKQPADKVTVQIKDAAGNVIRNMDLGSQPSGIVPIQWDGKNSEDTKMGEGHYQFSASAQLGSEKSSITTLSYGLVSGVNKKAEGASLNVDQIGETSMDSVKQIL